MRYHDLVETYKGYTLTALNREHLLSWRRVNDDRLGAHRIDLVNLAAICRVKAMWSNKREAKWWIGATTNLLKQARRK